MPEIQLQPHDPMWATLYKIESMRLRDALNSFTVRINHIGSTAIPGIKAKPIVDISLECDVFPPSDLANRALEKLGYKNHGKSGVAGRCWFTKGNPRAFNLHWCPTGGSVAQAQITFRDTLRCDAKLALQYEAIKIAAAPGTTIDSSEYANAKSDFILSVLAKL